MDISIVIGYGTNETNAIDITEYIINNYLIDNKIVISSKDLFEKINNKFFIDWLEKNISWIMESDISDSLLLLFQKIFINIFHQDKINKKINFVVHANYHRDINIDLEKEYNIDYTKNIIICPHIKYTEGDGGINVMYYLAKKLDAIGKNVRIYPSFGAIQNPHFNKFYNNDFDIADCIVIYCEGTIGNPLCARNSVRWMLSKLGQNVPYHDVNTWNPKEPVYYFNTELKIESSPHLKGSIYKLLPLLIIPPIFQNISIERIKDSSCFAIRKGNHMRKKGFDMIHPSNSFEIEIKHSHSELLHFFNTYETFFSYDPITFLNIMAVLCGCISVVVPMPDMNKDEWLKTTAGYGYLSSHNIESYYGIAYGFEELEWAKSTIHLAKKQWDDIIAYNNTFFESFVEDLNHLEDGTLQNTIENNYFK